MTSIDQSLVPATLSLPRPLRSYYRLASRWPSADSFECPVEGPVFRCVRSARQIVWSPRVSCTCTWPLVGAVTVIPGEGKNTIGPVITQLDTRVHRQYGFRICQVRSDNEPALGNAFPAWCKREGIDWIPSSTYTSAQNGGAERAGGVIIRKARAIRILAPFSESY